MQVGDTLTVEIQVKVFWGDPLSEVNVKVATETDLQCHEGADLVVFDKVTHFKRAKASTLKELKTEVAASLNLGPENLRLWHCIPRQNKTVRPDLPCSPAEEERSLELISNTAGLDLKFFVEEAVQNVPFTAVRQGEMLLFFKFYTPETQTLRYIGSRMVLTHKRPADLFPLVLQMTGLAPTTELVVYEEVKPTMIERLDGTLTLADNELDNGDIVVFQTKESHEDARSSLAKIPYYYNFMTSKQTVQFHLTNVQLGRPQEEEVRLMLELCSYGVYTCGVYSYGLYSYG